MLALFSSILLVLHPASQVAPPDPDWNCDDPVAQQEMNWCAAREFEVMDMYLNEQWEVTSARMKSLDESYEENPFANDTRPGYFATLLEAQRAWLTFRDAHCRGEGYVARGGSLEPLLVSTCKTALTDARTVELRSLAEDMSR